MVGGAVGCPPSRWGAAAWQIEKGRKENLAAFFYLDLKRYKPTTLQMTPFENEQMEDPKSVRTCVIICSKHLFLN